jgi:hypothetical protein
MPLALTFSAMMRAAPSTNEALPAQASPRLPGKPNTIAHVVDLIDAVENGMAKHLFQAEPGSRRGTKAE